MNMRVWPPGGLLRLSSLVEPSRAFVLLLPIAQSVCQGSDDEATAAESTAKTVLRDIRGAVLRWCVVHRDKNVVVFVRYGDTRAACEASVVFDSVCRTGSVDALSVRECAFTLDQLRALLWQIANARRNEDAPRRSRLALVRGFERLRAAQRMDSSKKSVANMNLDADEDSEELEDDCMSDNYHRVSLDEESDANRPNSALQPPSLSLPLLPALPAPLVSPGTSTLMKRQRSLRPLDLGQLLDTDRTKNTPEAATRVATAALSKVRDYLFVGGVASASLPVHILRAQGIDAVVNLAAAAVHTTQYDDIEYTRIYARDAENEDAAAWLPVALEAAERARKRGSGVLVHCHRGVSRSAATVAAVLMVEEGLSVAQALKDVRSARPITSPNPGFVRALQTLEETLKGNGPCRRAVLARLRDDPGDGEECLVLERDAAALATERVWAAVVIERGKGAGVEVVRGALVHEARWRTAVRYARWLERSVRRREESSVVSSIGRGQTFGEVGHKV